VLRAKIHELYAPLVVNVRVRAVVTDPAVAANIVASLANKRARDPPSAVGA
jgi:hypothetical protein